MYDGMKKAFGPSAIKTAPLKSLSGEIITDRGKQMERWAEHYQELYSRQNTVTDTAVEGITPLSTMGELDIPPSINELQKAINSLSCGKAPGSDGIPPEVVKLGKESSLLSHLHNLLLQCWEEGSLPQDMRDAKTPKPQNPKTPSAINNFCSISKWWIDC